MTTKRPKPLLLTKGVSAKSVATGIVLSMAHSLIAICALATVGGPALAELPSRELAPTQPVAALPPTSSPAKSSDLSSAPPKAAPILKPSPQICDLKCQPNDSMSTAEPAKLPDVSTFLLGSGVALLIALLAWGEQIRAITRDTRDLERDFLELTDISKSQLNSVLDAETDDDRLVAFTNLMASGNLTSASQIQLLPLFNEWRALGANLQNKQSQKYWFTIALTLVLFCSGTVAAIFSIGVYLLVSVTLPPGILVVILLWIVVSAGRLEQKLNVVLKKIAEKV